MGVSLYTLPAEAEDVDFGVTTWMEHDKRRWFSKEDTGPVQSHDFPVCSECGHRISNESTLLSSKY